VQVVCDCIMNMSRCSGMLLEQCLLPHQQLGLIRCNQLVCVCVMLEQWLLPHQQLGLLAVTHVTCMWSTCAEPPTISKFELAWIGFPGV
jgi:hypothetical protein